MFLYLAKPIISPLFFFQLLLMQYLILTTSVRKDVPRNYLDVASIGTSVYEGKSEVDRYVSSHQVYNATTLTILYLTWRKRLAYIIYYIFFPWRRKKKKKSRTIRMTPRILKDCSHIVPFITADTREEYRIQILVWRWQNYMWVIFLRNRKHFPCFHTVIETREWMFRRTRNWSGNTSR